VDEDTWREFALPTHKGGLSLRTTSIHASAAYLASVDGSYSLTQSLYALDYSPVALSEAIVDFNARAPQAPLYVEDFPHLQTPLVQGELSAGTQKKRKHRKACAEHQLQFVPMSVDHWGKWGKESEAAFEHVARAYAAAVGKSRHKVRSTICADLNSLLAVTNVHMLAKRVPL